MGNNEKIDKILSNYPAGRQSALAIIHDIQKEQGYISAENLKDIANHLDITVAEVFEDITFYDVFTTEKQGNVVIQVCDGMVCRSRGSKDLLAEVETALGIKAGETTRDGAFTLRLVKCMGACECSPVISCNGKTYGNLQKGDAAKMMEDCKNEGTVTGITECNEMHIIPTKFDAVLLKSADTIDEYITQGGFEGFENALRYRKRLEIIKEISKSGLRGRSGSGFPVGMKWDGAYNAPGRDSSDDKYVVANGDEGDQGAYMDRWFMERSPYAVIEGLIIAGYCIGACKGYLYIRDEYPNAIDRMESALEDVREKRFLGKDILDSGFDFDCKVVRAAGSYICGEEGALMESVEGKPGVPRVKPPFPTWKGVFLQPTIVNNIETLANVPLILREGADKYAERGVANCTGHKVFSLSGSVRNKGLVEVPMGKVTLRELIYDIGGGMEQGSKFKCAQIGGPLGGFITEKDLDLPLDFDSIKKSGVTFGSGGIVVMDDRMDAVGMLQYMVSFLADESCGMCTPCREGLRCMVDILAGITADKGDSEDIETIKDLAFAAKVASRCEFGKAISNPVMSALENFKDEFEILVTNKEKAAV